jgi:hypothetical protein
VSRKTYQAVAIAAVILTVLIVAASIVWLNAGVGRGPGN